MRGSNVKETFAAQRDTRPTRPTTGNLEGEQTNPTPVPEAMSAQPYPGISTERIMHAVERQRRITEQLDDLRAQQRQRTARLRRIGVKVLAWICCLLGLGIVALLLLFALEPGLLARTLRLLSGVIALLLAVGESIQATLAHIPSNSWVLPGAALTFVLMVALWLYLMRHPREV